MKVAFQFSKRLTTLMLKIFLTKKMKKLYNKLTEVFCHSNLNDEYTFQNIYSLKALLQKNNVSKTRSTINRIPTIMTKVANQETSRPISATASIRTPWTRTPTSTASVIPRWWRGTVTVTPTPHLSPYIHTKEIHHHQEI